VVTTTYLYDVNDERIAGGANSATTTYPFTFYNVATSSSGKATFTKHIFANGEDIADVQGSTTTAKVYYIHDDALGGTNVISNASGTVAEVLDYYPFGGIRVNQQATSTLGEQRRFTGHEFDAGTGLNYMDARYEGPNLSRFLSENPNFINNPQNLNTYKFRPLNGRSMRSATMASRCAFPAVR
jgi:RHS repeat-associated protein